MGRRLNHAPNTIHYPGMWRFPTDRDHCCIYRVPHRLRRVNPEAYTPQLLLIGPLNHSLKSQAFDSLGNVTNTKSMGYLNMEEHKKIYLAEFTRRVEGELTIDGFRRIIEGEEERIRASYSESTAWIQSSKFVNMILLDSVFILEFFVRNVEYYYSRIDKTGDPIVDQRCLEITIREDLIMLENQLPFFILEKIFNPVVPILNVPELEVPTFRGLVIKFFSFEGKIKDDSIFSHFTDLLRLVRMETREPEVSISEVEPTKTKFRYLADLFRCPHGLSESTKTKFRFIADRFRCVRLDKRDSSETTEQSEYTKIKHMYNAEKLYSAGVKFVAMENELSIDVKFENGCLKIPSLWVSDDVEIVLRNIIALEQCHYPLLDYVCNYVTFLDFLIDTDKDVDLLMENGILHSWIGEQNSVAEMVNKLLVGVTEWNSCYAEIASRINAYYESPMNRSRAVLGRKYFGNIWTGTATVAATLLLVMTLTQTVASIIQVMQK